MGVISYNDFFKKKKKKEDEDDIAPTKKSGSVISLEDFAKENNMKISLDKPKTDSSKGNVGSLSDSYVSLSDDELSKKEKELQEQLLNYDRKEKRKWWDKEDNVLENAGNVLYKLFAEKQEDKYAEDDTYDSLKAQYDAIVEARENRYVANKKYKDGAIGYAEKVGDTISGNALTSMKGIETTAKKILGQTPDERLTTQSFQEKLSAKARQETDGIGGVGLDVVGSVTRMLPQMMVGNPIGATALGFANYGGSAYNQARQDGYSDEQATAYGVAIGSMEMIMTKALGSFGNIYGKSAVGKASQSIIDKTIPKIISNKQVREVIAQFGSEATEEFLQEYIDGIAKDTLLDGEGFLKSTWKNITDEDKFSDALYSAFVGGITGSAMATSGAIDSYRYEKATGRNYETGLTQNEQTVVDKVTEQRTSEKQKQAAINKEVEKTIKAQEKTFGTLSDGEKQGIKQRIQEKVESGEIDIANTKLSKKEVEKIQREVREDLEKGYIDIDTIDSTFSGEKTVQIKQLQEELSNTKDDTKKAEIQAKISELTSARASELQGKFNNDIYLQRSYIENAKKGEKFTYEAKETDSDYRKTLTEEFKEKANDTNKTHETYEMLVKLSEEKNTQYHITNTEELKNMGYDVEGSDINGLVRVDKDGSQRILINIDSNKAINRIVGHETTHLLEGTKEYKTFQEYIKNYAKAKGEYDTRYKQTSNLYTGIDADIDAEVTADLVGDYLFTDTDFINNLSVEQTTIFQKIYSEIKHLYNLATAGSKEARELERVKKAFDKAYRQNVASKGTDTKLSIGFEEIAINERTSNSIEMGSKIADVLMENNPDKIDLQDVIVLADQYAYGDNPSVEERNNEENIDFSDSLIDNTKSVLRNSGYEFDELSEVFTKNIRYSLSETQENYFKDSKLRDDNGNLKVVYHSTPNEFTVFDSGMSGENTGYDNTGFGTFVTTNKAFSERFKDIDSNGTEGYTMELFANATNPIIHPYKADLKYSESELEQIVTDYLTATNNEDGLAYLNEMVEDGEADSLYEGYMIMAQEGNMFENVAEERKALEDAGYDSVEIIEGIESELVDDSQSNEVVTSYAIFNSNQLKNTDNTNPTNDPDIRYSLSATDNQGRNLSKEQQEFFKDVSPEVKNENGYLKRFYHGSNSEFTVFDKTKGGASNSNAGVGFWFAESSEGAKNFADSVWYGDRDENGQRKSKVYEVYLNLKNPKIYEPVDTKSQKQELNKQLKELYYKKMGIQDEYSWETPSITILSDYLKSYEENQVLNALINNYGYKEEKAKNYIEVAKEYKQLNEEYKNIEKQHDDLGYDDSYEQFRTDIYKIAGMGADDANTGGVGMHIDNKEQVIEQYVNTLKEQGYDGIIIKNTEYDSDTMGGTNTQYVVFESNQIKNIDNLNPTINDDINLSLFNPDEQIAPSRNDVFGSDIKLQVEEAIAPLQEEIAELKEVLQNSAETLQTTAEDEYAPMTEEEFNMYEEQDRESFRNIDETSYVPEEVEDIPYQPQDTTSIDDKSLKMLSKNIKSELGLDKYQTSKLEGIIQDFSTGKITTKEELYREIKRNFSEYTEQVRVQEIKNVQNDLRATRINVSKNVQSGVKDYYRIKQKNFGKIKFSKEGMGVDSVYQELSNKYPDYFPADIDTESDQFLRMVEVANMQNTFNEKYVLPNEIIQDAVNFITESVEDYKYNEFMKAVGEQSRLPIDDSMIPVEAIEETVEDASDTEVKEEIAPVKEQPTEENKNLTVKESNALKLKNLEKALEQNRLDAQNSFDSFKELIAEKNKQYDSLKNKDTLKANNILQQVNRLVTQRDNIQVEYERKANRLQERMEKMNSKEFKVAEQRMSKQEEYRSQARNLIGDTSTWVDKKLGIQYQINTLKRNLRDIVRGADGKADILRADAIYEEYQGKYNKNEAKLKVEYNKIIDPYAELKLTNEEHVYTQMLGEFKYNPDTTLTEQTVENYYNKHKNKIDVDKVNNAIESARQTYDSLFDRINEALRNQGMKELEYRRGYFPHFVEDKQSFIAKLFDWKVRNDQIPTDIAGLTELNNPERSWQSFNKHRESDITDYNFGKGLETYVRGALDWIYHIEDIQKRRALENEIRYQHSEEGVKEKIELIYSDPSLDADEVQTQIEAIYNVAKNPLNNFVTDLRNSTNNLAGKKSTMDRSLEYATNRQIYSTMTNLSNRVSGNMIGGSISSALTNFIPITQSWGQVNPTSSLRGMLETIKSSIKDDGTIAKSSFLTNRLVKNENLYKTGWDKAADKVAIMTDVIDSFTAQTIWRSKYNENINNGMSEMEAIADADRFSENVIAGRSRGNEPTIFNSKNPLIKMFTAFQLEVNNQYQYMFKDMPVDVGSKGKLVKGYATMFIGAYLYNALYSSLVGRDAAFDPIGLVEDILKELGFGDDDEEDEKTASEKFTAISEDLIQQLPFVGGLFGGGRVPLSAAIPYENPIEMVKGTATDLLDALDEDKREKALKDLTSEWLKPVVYLALPFGGGQINKTIQGLSMYDDDLPVAGSYTNSGDLRFTADESLGGKVKSALFGRWASDSAQEYVDSGFKTVKKSNIEEMLDLDMNSTEYRKYRNGLNKAGTKNEDKLDYINSLDVSAEHKNIMANNVLDRDYKVDMDNYSSYDEFDYSYKYPEKYSVISQIDTFENYTTYKEEIEKIKEQYSTDEELTSKQKTALSKQRKAAIQQYIQSLDLDIPQKMMLEKMAGGYSINSYKSYLQEYIESLPLTAEEKQTIDNQLFK